MSLLGTDSLLPVSSLSKEDEFLIKMILLTNDPDGRRFDAELLLHAVETIMFYATASEGSDQHLDVTAKGNVRDIEVLGSGEPLGHTIYKISTWMLWQCSVDRHLHTKTMDLFDVLGQYRWDAKVALILAAFATSYGQFCLIMQLYSHNPLAASVAMLKQLPNNLTALKPRFKALRTLIKTMIDVTKCIIKFEGLPLQYVVIDTEAMAATKSQIYLSTYWVIRSAFACSFQIKDLIAIKNEQVHSNSATIAKWELSSLVCRLSGICSRLRQLMDVCHQLIETRIHKKLLNIFEETHTDNQEVLHTLFALKDDLPLRRYSSQTKLGISELKDKIVILLITKPELFPLERLLLLVQQTYDHPHQEKFEGRYAIVWVPLPSSNTWTGAEERSFDFISNFLPWYSIRQPWLLNSAVMNFIKHAWNFKEEPLLVILDSKGIVTNKNAIDMLLIWGVMRAYPFSASREKELWEEGSWTMQLLTEGIDPLLSKWVDDERNLCIYGGDNIDWFSKFTAKMREIISAGVQLEMVYVGKKIPSKHTSNILDSIGAGGSLTSAKMQFFWLRLDSIRRSKLQLGYTREDDCVLKEVCGLLDMDDDKNDKGWAVMGRRGSSKDIVKLPGKDLLDCLNRFPDWIENVGKLGLVGAITSTANETPHLVGPCHHTYVIPYDEELAERTVVCDKCHLLKEKFVMYKCDGTD